MPTNLTDADEFTSPVTAPAGADPRIASTFTNPLQQLANRTRYLANLLGGGDGTGEWTYPTPRTRRVLVSLTKALPVNLAIPGWNPPADPRSNNTWGSAQNNGLLKVPLDSDLRDGMTIYSIGIAVKPGVARTGTNRIGVGLYYHTPDFATPANNPVAPTLVGSVIYDDASDDEQVIDLIDAFPSGHLVVREGATTRRDYYLVIKAGNTGLSDLDALYGIGMTVDDPGPRNT